MKAPENVQKTFKHATRIRIQGKSSRAHGYDIQPTLQPRVFGKLGQVCFPTHLRNGVPWLFGKFSNNVLVSPKRQSKGLKKDCQRLIDNPSMSIRALSRLVWKLSSSIQAVLSTFPAF